MEKFSCTLNWHRWISRIYWGARNNHLQGTRQESPRNFGRRGAIAIWSQRICCCNCLLKTQVLAKLNKRCMRADACPMPESQVRGWKLTIEALVNGGSNSESPKVAKFIDLKLKSSTNGVMMVALSRKWIRWNRNICEDTDLTDQDGKTLRSFIVFWNWV